MFVRTVIFYGNEIKIEFWTSLNNPTHAHKELRRKWCIFFYFSSLQSLYGKDVLQIHSLLICALGRDDY